MLCIKRRYNQNFDQRKNNLKIKANKKKNYLIEVFGGIYIFWHVLVRAKLVFANILIVYIFCFVS